MAKILLFLGSLFLVGCSTYQSLDYNDYIHYTYQDEMEVEVLPKSIEMVQVIDTGVIIVNLPDFQTLPTLQTTTVEQKTISIKTTDYPFTRYTENKHTAQPIVTATTNSSSEYFSYAAASATHLTYTAPSPTYHINTTNNTTGTGKNHKKHTSTTHPRTIIYDPIIINPRPVVSKPKNYTKVAFAILQKSFGGVLFHPILPKQQIRMDDLGEGHFGASRNRRSHAGVDLVVSKGDTIYAPIDGVITRKVYPYGAKKSWRGCELTGVKQYSGYKLKIFYIKPIKNVGHLVKAGEPIGIAQAISAKYSHHMVDHIHVEVRKYNYLIDPVNIFQVNDVHSLF